MLLCLPMNNTNTQSVNLLSLAVSICAALPGVWTASKVSPEDGEDGAAQLVRADGLELWIPRMNGGWAPKGRIAVRYSRPRDAKKQYLHLYESAPSHGKIADPEITVSPSKTGEQIASDIIRRMLPECERIQALALANNKAHNDYETNRRAALVRLASIAGTQIRENGNNGAIYYSLYITPQDRAPDDYGNVLATVEVRSADSVKFDLSPDAGKAAALIAFLRSPAYLNA